MNMVLSIIRFEWRYHTRRLTFVASAGFFLLFGYLLTSGPSPFLEIHVNAAYSLAYSIGLLSLVGVFVLTLFCAQSVLRDSEHRMAEIVYTTAVSKVQYLVGHFASVLLATLSVCSFTIVGMILGTVLPGHDPSTLGPFDLIDYLWPFVLFVVPNMIFVGAILFTIGALSRSTVATYVTGVAFYMLYLLTAMLTNSPLIASSSPATPDGLALAAMLDPFGFSAFFEQTHYWTPTERNENRIALAGFFLLNRALWLGLAGMVLVFGFRRFAFRLPSGSAGTGADVVDDSSSAGPYRPIESFSGTFAHWWRGFVSSLRMEALQVLRRWPFWVLLVLWTGMIAAQLGTFVRHGEYGTWRVPVTAILLDQIREPLIPVALLVLIYYSAEMVWRERSLRFEGMADATPVSNAVPLIAKITLLTTMLVALTLVASLVGVAIQLVNGPLQPDLVAYLSQLYFVVLPLALVGVLAVVLQTISPNRYVGMMATLAAVAVLHRGAFGGPSHPLVRYAATPDVRISPMAGVAPDASAFHWLVSYWSLVAFLLILVAYGMWKRGEDIRFLPRLRALPRALGHRSRWLALGLCLLLLPIGSSIFYQTNIVNAYQTVDEAAAWRADYERAYRHLEDVAQPSLTHMEIMVDLYPRERRYRIDGTYRMENQTPETIHTVWFTAQRDVQVDNLLLDGTPPAALDERFSVASFVLESPLEPGASADLSYTIDVDRSAMAAGGVDGDIRPRGTFILNRVHMPRMGYRMARELSDPVRRRKHGLPAVDRPTTIEGVMEMGLANARGEGITFDITISTDADQTAVAPGERRSVWVDGDRRFARFAMQRPVHPLLGYVSAPYEVEHMKHENIDIEVYFHSAHAANIPRFLEAAALALDTFSEAFGPYLHDHLRIVEVPSGRPFTGMAAGGTTYFVETGGFLTDLRASERVDIVTKRVSHEIAHQWWGGRVKPATGPGATTLVESTARYSELIMLARRHGPAAATAALGFERDRYLTGRATQAEVPLYQTVSESFLFYAKGALVMMALHDLLGEDAVNRALRSLVQQADDPDRALTSLDLIAALYGVASPVHHELIDQWWKQIVLYDLRIDAAHVESLPDGQFRVVADVVGSKHAVEGDREIALPFEETLQIAAYSHYPRTATSYDGLIDVVRYSVTGANQIELVVTERPRYLCIDPFLRRIERNRVDNVAEVTTSH